MTTSTKIKTTCFGNLSTSTVTELASYNPRRTKIHIKVVGNYPIHIFHSPTQTKNSGYLILGNTTETFETKAPIYAIANNPNLAVYVMEEEA